MNVVEEMVNMIETQRAYEIFEGDLVGRLDAPLLEPELIRN